MPLSDFMKLTLENQGLTYEISNQTILVSKEKGVIAELSRELEKKFPPINGIVRGPEGQPLAGVNIVIKGTKKGTVTDKDGRFTIEAEEGNVLEISSIGFGKQEISINGLRELVVALDISLSVLDE